MSQKIQNRRGFEIIDGLNTIGIALVKADAEKVSQHLAKARDGRSQKIDNIQAFNFANFKCSDLVIQYKKHPYSIFCKSILFKDIILDISEILKTRCLYFEHEDCSSWSGYYLYQDGICLESYSYGYDYTEEFTGGDLELLKEYRENRNNRYDTWTVNNYSEYLFSSRLRTATKEEITDHLTFLDNFFKSQDTWLPNLHFISPSYISNTEIMFDLDYPNLDELLTAYIIIGSSDYKYSVDMEIPF